MKELRTFPKIEARYLRGAGQHSGALEKLAKNLTLEVLGQNGFARPAEEELEQYFSSPENLRLAAGVLSQSLNTFPKLEASCRVPGHGLDHIIDVSASAVRILANERRKPLEEFEILMGVLVHDIETEFEGNSDLPSSQAASLLLLSFSKAFLKQIPELKSFPRAMVSKTLYDISSGSKATTEHWTADVVHQCDREQLIGPPTIAREGSRQIPIPENEEFKTRLPIPKRPDDRFWLVQYEFYMRNLFPPVSQDGEQVWQALKVDNATILLLATKGKGDLRRQIFAPELAEVDEANLHWSKRKLPGEILPLAQTLTQEFLDYIEKKAPYNPEIDLVAMAANMPKIEGVTSSEDFEQKIRAYIEVCDATEKRNLYYVFSFSMKRRQEERNKIITLTEGLVSDEKTSDFLKTAAKFVAQEMEKRNQNEQLASLNL